MPGLYWGSMIYLELFFQDPISLNWSYSYSSSSICSKGNVTEVEKAFQKYFEFFTVYLIVDAHFYSMLAGSPLIQSLLWYATVWIWRWRGCGFFVVLCFKDIFTTGCCRNIGMSEAWGYFEMICGSLIIFYLFKILIYQENLMSHNSTFTFLLRSTLRMD